MENINVPLEKLSLKALKKLLEEKKIEADVKVLELETIDSLILSIRKIIREKRK